MLIGPTLAAMSIDIKTTIDFLHKLHADRDALATKLAAAEAELKHLQNVLALRERQGRELVELLKPYIPEKMCEPEVFAGVRGALARIAELEAKLAAAQKRWDPDQIGSAPEGAPRAESRSFKLYLRRPDGPVPAGQAFLAVHSSDGMVDCIPWPERMWRIRGEELTDEPPAAPVIRDVESGPAEAGTVARDAEDFAAQSWAAIAGALWDTLHEIANLDPQDDVLSKSQYRGAVRKLAARRLDLVAPEHVHRGGPLPTRATDDARELAWLRDIYDRAHAKPAMLSNTTGQKWAIVPLEQVKQVGDGPRGHVVQHKDTAELKTTDPRTYYVNAAEKMDLQEREPDKVVAGLFTPIDRKVAVQTKVPPFCSMERAAALWDLLVQIENTGPWGAEHVEHYHSQVMKLCAERHRYFGVCGDQLAPVGSFGVGPVGRWTREEQKIEAAASKVFDTRPVVGTAIPCIVGRDTLEEMAGWLINKICLKAASDRIRLRSLAIEQKQIRLWTDEPLTKEQVDAFTAYCSAYDREVQRQSNIDYLVQYGNADRLQLGSLTLDESEAVVNDLQCALGRGEHKHAPEPARAAAKVRLALRGIMLDRKAD